MHVFVSGRLSLELLGTLKWRRDDPEELLRSPSDVREWFAAAPLGLQVSPEPMDVVGVRAVREALYRTVAAIRADARPGRRDVTLLNDVAASSGPDMRLMASGAIRRSATVEQALSVVVRDAYEVLLGDGAARINDCANPRCTRLFIDSSRSGNRRWCGMTECGNTAKVSAFRARRRGRG